jgi:hypothetical protein
MEDWNDDASPTIALAKVGNNGRLKKQITDY